MLLTLNSLSHLLVDALCASTLFGPLRHTENIGVLILLYNTLAFSTQCLVGLAADRSRFHAWAASLSMVMIFAGFVLPVPPVLRVALIGLGNSVFHVAGGIMTLERSRGRAGDLGVFVAPGAIGLTLGTLWPKLGWVFAVLILAAAVLTVPAASRSPIPEGEGIPGKGADKGAENLFPAVLLTLAVAVRAVGGTCAEFPWKTGAALTLLLTLFVFAGKTAGGFVCDRIGASSSAAVSVLPAAVLISFCAAWMIPSLLGQFALNLTMPVTLWLMYRAMPDSPGLAFGLAASALWPGTIIGQLITLTGPAQKILTLVCFLFGFAAILWSVRVLKPEKRIPNPSPKGV